MYVCMSMGMHRKDVCMYIMSIRIYGNHILACSCIDELVILHNDYIYKRTCSMCVAVYIPAHRAGALW